MGDEHVGVAHDHFDSARLGQPSRQFEALEEGKLRSGRHLLEEQRAVTGIRYESIVAPEDARLDQETVDEQGELRGGATAREPVVLCHLRRSVSEDVHAGDDIVIAQRICGLDRVAENGSFPDVVTETALRAVRCGVRLSIRR